MKSDETYIHRIQSYRRFSASSLGCGLRKLPSANYRIAAIRNRIPDADPVHAGAIGHVQPDDSIQGRTQHVRGQGALQLQLEPAQMNSWGPGLWGFPE